MYGGMSHKLSMLKNKDSAPISSSQGPNYPGTAKNLSTGWGYSWYGLDNLTSDNYEYAEVLYNDFSPDIKQSDVLQVENFGFSIPSSATIDGIEVTLLLALIPPAESWEISILPMLFLGNWGSAEGIFYGNPTSYDNSIPSTRTVRTFGGSTNKWALSGTNWNGQSMTASVVNSSTFGFAISIDYFFPMSSDYTVYIDYITMKVYYTT